HYLILSLSLHDALPIFQKLRQHRTKILGNADSTDAMQIIQRPNNAGRPLVETGVTVSLPFFARVVRPEPVRIEIGDGIGRNFFKDRKSTRLNSSHLGIS